MTAPAETGLLRLFRQQAGRIDTHQMGAMPQYMLLLYDNPTNQGEFQKLSPEEMHGLMDKYMAWANRQFTGDSKRLAQKTGRVIRSDRRGKTRVADGPFSETKEVLGGYITIEAANYDEALKLTLDHPHLKHGGTIEIREVSWGRDRRC